ncbi:MAG: ABC transporter substrate-binding protein [Flavobacteriaceae bacterium]
MPIIGADDGSCRRWWQWRTIALWAWLPFACGTAAAGPQRIVSVNACADILLVDLVEPGRIVALSRNAGDPRLIPDPAKTAGFPRVGRTAEEAYALKPDLVLAGAFAGRDAKAFLRAHGVDVVDVGIAARLADVPGVILETGRALGEEARAARLAAGLDFPEPPPGPRPRALNLQRRGVIAGRGTLTDDLMHAAGLENAAPFEGYARLDAERLMTLDADLIVLNQEPGTPADQGEALLEHPALRAHFAGARRVVLPGNLTVCAGPHLIRAVEVLREAREQLLD